MKLPDSAEGAVPFPMGSRYDLPLVPLFIATHVLHKTASIDTQLSGFEFKTVATASLRHLISFGGFAGSEFDVQSKGFLGA